MQIHAEMKSTREQTDAEIEALGERIRKCRIEHEPAAVFRQTKRAKFSEKALSVTSATSRCVGDQIVDVDEAAVDQVIDAPVAGQCDGLAVFPGRQQAVALAALQSNGGEEILG